MVPWNAWDVGDKMDIFVGEILVKGHTIVGREKLGPETPVGR